jgi:hypothetical protein
MQQSLPAGFRYGCNFKGWHGKMPERESNDNRGAGRDPVSSRGVMTFKTFQEFYPFYLGEHADRTSRRLHVVGTSLGVLQLPLALITGYGGLILSGLVTGYAFAWVGHYFFEKNTPATFKYPLFSLRGDFTMARDVLTGRIPW